MDPWLSPVFADQSAAERFDRAVEVLLIALLAFMPLALGAVHAWSEEIVVALAAALSLVFLLKLVLVPDTRFVWTWAYVPVAVFLLVAAWQLLPLPASVVRVISPSTAALKADLLGDLPHAREVLSSMTLSFYPRATKHDLRLVLAAAAVFVIVVNVYRQGARVKRLLAAIAGLGGGIALLALAQAVAGNGKIYWLVPTYSDWVYSGTFINHSHYGQFMNLSLGAALALLLVALQEAFDQRRVTPARVAEYLSSPASTTVKLLAGVLVLGAATVFISLTRGGMLSMLIAGGFTALMLSWRRSLKGPGWVMVLLALGAFICVLYVGFDQVYDRLTTLRDFHGAQGGRWQIVKDIALAWTRFPVFGVGLGTHGVVYPMFDRSTTAALAMHAENEYAQAAEETGLVGLLALVLFGIVVWVGYSRNIGDTRIPIRAAAYGLGFGLLAIVIHSLSDFGQHLPANALLSVVYCGLLLALGPADREDQPHQATVPKYVATVAGRSVILVLVAGVWAWAVGDANAARVAEANWSKALKAEHHLEANDWRAGPQAYEYLFTHAAAAVKAEPENIQYRHWLGVYKWLSLTPYLDPNTGQLPPEALPWARQIVDELNEARPLGPTFGALYCVVGEIEKYVLGDPNGAARIHKGYRLAPCDATVGMTAARVDIEEGRSDAAFEKLTRAVQLDGGAFLKAARMCVEDLNRADLALRLAGEDADRLAYVGRLLVSVDKVSQQPLHDADELTGPAEPRRLAEQARGKAFERLKQQCDQPGAPASAHASLAGFYHQQGDLEAAIGHYRRAILSDYEQVGWHYALARLLLQTNRLDEAMREAKICLRLREDYAPAKGLLEELATRPAATGQSLSSGE